MCPISFQEHKNGSGIPRIKGSRDYVRCAGRFKSTSGSLTSLTGILGQSYHAFQVHQNNNVNVIKMRNVDIWLDCI